MKNETLNFHERFFKFLLLILHDFQIPSKTFKRFFRTNLKESENQWKTAWRILKDSEILEKYAKKSKFWLFWIKMNIKKFVFQKIERLWASWKGIKRGLKENEWVKNIFEHSWGPWSFMNVRERSEKQLKKNIDKRYFELIYSNFRNRYYYRFLS